MLANVVVSQHYTSHRDNGPVLDVPASKAIRHQHLFLSVLHAPPSGSTEMITVAGSIPLRPTQRR